MFVARLFKLFTDGSKDTTSISFACVKQLYKEYNPTFAPISQNIIFDLLDNLNFLSTLMFRVPLKISFYSQLRMLLGNKF